MSVVTFLGLPEAAVVLYKSLGVAEMKGGLIFLFFMYKCFAYMDG